MRRPVILIALGLVVGLPGCRRAAPVAPVPASAPAAAGAVPTATPPTASAAGPTAQHDPDHPPIDCPLRKQGVDPAKMKPFAEVERYIDFLERPDRAEWQKPDAVVAALGLKGTETVVDVGAGSGYFSFPIARALPGGKVVATDIEPEMIRHIHHEAMTEGVTNVEAVLAKPEDPGLPPGADLVFMCDVLHHVDGRAAWLDKLASEMKPGARLVVIEFKKGELPQGPPDSVKLSRGEIVKQVTAAGLVLADEKPELLPYQTYLVFRKP